VLLLSSTGIPMTEWNRTDCDYPAVCIHELFEEQVARTPERIAVCFEGHQLTYAELNAKANQLANYLVALGVGPEVLVGVSLPRSLEMLVGVLGILKAGGAYVPLDPAYPVERLCFMMEDSGEKLLVTDQQLASRLRARSGRTVLLDKDWSVIATLSAQNPSVGVMPGNLAYTLYTSGSTGKPKGVQIEHRSVVNFLTSMRQSPGLTADDVMLAVTTLSFDIAGLELYLPLITGARVVIVSREIALDGEQLLSAIEQNHATVLQATPVTWRLLLDAGWPDSDLKVICGGEALPRELARRLVNNTPSVWNLYGPTETTIWSSIYRVVDDGHLLVPIGRPIANTQMYILDPTLNPVSVGAIGELYIGGDGLARGYLNRPELTAQKFISNSFRAGMRLYKTGDLARYLPSGDIEFLGRIDHQVKIRGFRIELGEIEAVLEQHTDIQQAVVVAREWQSETRLLAYVVTNGHPHPASGALRSLLRKQLPDYMVPAAFISLQALPLTPNGKIDRDALPAPDATNTLADEGYAAPGTVLEEKLSGIVANLLGLERVGVNDNFFLIGGHSLFGTQLIARIQATFGVELPLRSIFDLPTPALLAREIESQIMAKVNAMDEAQVESVLQDADSRGWQP